MRLYADVPPTGTGTDTVGAQLGIDSLGTALANNADPLVFAPTVGVSLVAGTKYWLGLSGSSGTAFDSDLSWYRGSGPATTRRFDGVYYPNASPYAFAVNPTPEPSVLAALGLGAVAVLRRRKRA